MLRQLMNSPHFLLEFNLSEYTVSLPMVEDNTRKRRNLRSFTKTKRRQNKHPSIPKNPFPKAIYSTIRFSLTTTKKKIILNNYNNSYQKSQSLVTKYQKNLNLKLKINHKLIFLTKKKQIQVKQVTYYTAKSNNVKKS